MILSIKILEEAINIREKEIKILEILDCEFSSDDEFIRSDIKNFESQIAELKNAVKILYDANRLQEISTKLEK